jgi:branched-chain amino acid transport system ATP-binding protein
MIDVLRKVRTNGVTVVLVEHDMPSVMEVSDRVLVLDAGRLIADGSPNAVANDPKVIARLSGDAGRGLICLHAVRTAGVSLAQAHERAHGALVVPEET